MYGSGLSTQTKVKVDFRMRLGEWFFFCIDIIGIIYLTMFEWVNKCKSRNRMKMSDHKASCIINNDFEKFETLKFANVIWYSHDFEIRWSTPSILHLLVPPDLDWHDRTDWMQCIYGPRPVTRRSRHSSRTIKLLIRILKPCFCDWQTRNCFRIIVQF